MHYLPVVSLIKFLWNVCGLSGQGRRESWVIFAPLVDEYAAKRGRDATVTGIQIRAGHYLSIQRPGFGGTKSSIWTGDFWKKKDTRIRNTANLQVKRIGRRDIRGHCGFSPAMPFIHVHNRGTSILHGLAHGDLHRQFVFLPYTAPNGCESAGTGRRVWLRRTMYRDVHTPWGGRIKYVFNFYNLSFSHYTLKPK